MCCDQERKAADVAREEQHDHFVRTVRTRNHQRNADMQLVVESQQGLDMGRKTIVLEPPSRAIWEKPSPPHLVSHWETIVSHHRDPPPRKHERMIMSYRKAFPSAELRTRTPREPMWGGSA